VNGEWIARVGKAYDKTDQYGGVQGIDFFANILRHEEQHRLDFNELWFKMVKEPIYDPQTGELLGYRDVRQTTGVDSTRDTDGDWLPDDKEPTLFTGFPYVVRKEPPTYPDNDNYGIGWSDSEHYAKARQPRWTKGSANKEDWGAPGMQFKTNNKHDD
jgi:hypothetical protein